MCRKPGRRHGGGGEPTGERMREIFSCIHLKSSGLWCVWMPYSFWIVGQGIRPAVIISFLILFRHRRVVKCLRGRLAWRGKLVSASPELTSSLQSQLPALGVRQTAGWEHPVPRREEQGAAWGKELRTAARAASLLLHGLPGGGALISTRAKTSCFEFAF